MKKTTLALVTVVLLIAVIPLANLALASESPPLHFESALIGSMPNTPIRGVPSGGVPWVVAQGHTVLSPQGALELTVHGLLITGTGTSLDGTTGPVKMVFASLTCEGSDVVASTSPVPLSQAGNAQIEQTIQLPATCFGPIILVRVFIGSSATNPWIATTGFMGQ